MSTSRNEALVAYVLTAMPTTHTVGDHLSLRYGYQALAAMASHCGSDDLQTGSRQTESGIMSKLSSAYQA